MHALLMPSLPTNQPPTTPLTHLFPSARPRAAWSLTGSSPNPISNQRNTLSHDGNALPAVYVGVAMHLPRMKGMQQTTA